jgi:hypothetical protein
LARGHIPPQKWDYFSSGLHRLETHGARVAAVALAEARIQRVERFLADSGAAGIAALASSGSAARVSK